MPFAIPRPRRAERAAAVLFDADGVLQRRRPGFVRGLLQLGGPGFLVDAIRAETRCLTGQRRLIDELEAVVDRHRIAESAEKLAARWLHIELDSNVIDEVAGLRRRGLRCCLATNQDQFRGQYMSEVLGLDAHFDASYYSYRLGAAKPDPAFFRAVLRDLAVPPASVLYLDDLPQNVLAARRLGIDARLHAWRSGASGVRRAVSSRG